MLASVLSVMSQFMAALSLDRFPLTSVGIQACIRLASAIEIQRVSRRIVEAHVLWARVCRETPVGGSGAWGKSLQMERRSRGVEVLSASLMLVFMGMVPMVKAVMRMSLGVEFALVDEGVCVIGSGHIGG